MPVRLFHNTFHIKDKFSQPVLCYVKKITNVYFHACESPNFAEQHNKKYKPNNNNNNNNNRTGINFFNTLTYITKT